MFANISEGHIKKLISLTMKLNLVTITSYLKEPYPYYYGNAKRVFLLLVFLSFLSFSFSYFFEPFHVNVSEHKINSYWILLIHACIPIPIAFLFLSFINRSKKDDIAWSLGKEISILSLILLSIGIVDFLIRDLIYTNPDNWSFRYLGEEIRNTFLVGFLLLMIVLPINLERLISKHRSGLKKLPSFYKQETTNSLVVLNTSITSETIELQINDFLFAKVESNYTEVFTSSSNGVHKTLYRLTLKELEEQLKSFPFIFKTHRSYLVNLDAIESISGNAQGYQLAIKNYAPLIPVSRSKIVTFNLKYSNS